MKFPSVAKLCGRIGWCQPSKEPRPKATPLPVLKVFVVSFVLFANQLGSVMIFPFIPFMVHDFFPELSREELGKKAGYLGSAFFVGNFIGSIGWGWASDIFGRKRVMLIGLCGTIFSELLFGFSQSFSVAVAARFLWGMLNGNLGVGKTYISEICDDTNQARGFSAIGIGSGLGRLIGSAIGGFLARPAAKYTAFQTPLFCVFPYVLPCLVGAVVVLLSLIAAAVVLHETLHKSQQRDSSGGDGDSEKKDSSDSGIELSKQLQDGEEDEEASGEKDRMITEALASLEETESDIDSESDDGCWTRCGQCATACLNCTPRKVGAFLVTQLKGSLHKLLEVGRVMTDRRVLIITSLYTIYATKSVMFAQGFPLLMVTDYHHGGYNLDDNEIGMVIICSGIVPLIWQLALYPYVVRWLGYRRTLQFALGTYVVCAALLPLSNLITGPINSMESANNTNDSGNVTLDMNATDLYCGRDVLEDSMGVNPNSVWRIPIRVWVVVITIMMITAISRVSGFITVFVLIGNTTLPSTRGAVNGISQSMAAVGRSVGPVLGSTVFAWSENNGLGWPLNYHFVFDLCAVLGVVLIIISLFLPKSSETKRETLEG